ncbi:MAG: DHH family phosphoesterase [Candidatus Thorarchaeota archaeon]|jgi:RecJ-like exonuclease
MSSALSFLPETMQNRITDAADAIRASKKILAISHVDADGISALAIVVRMLERENKETVWRNIHQLNSETIVDVEELIEENNPDLLIFSDMGTGQMELILNQVVSKGTVKRIIVLDHHLPQEAAHEGRDDDSIIEINPNQHDLDGGYDVSGAGIAFLVAYALSKENVDLSELAIVGATGDLQDYYGKGFQGANQEIVHLGKEAGYIEVDRDLTFFGINTRPLPYLLEYATEPYLPGITGNEPACFSVFEQLRIPVKDPDDNWRIWTGLPSKEKQAVIQYLFDYIIEVYGDPRIAEGIVGDVITLIGRPKETEMRSAKEFSTLLNACGRNRRSDVGVQICLGDEDAYHEGTALLQQHRANLASALRRLEDDGYTEMDGMYLVKDPLTSDTIIGIVIGMAQGSRIVPINKPIIGVSTNTTNDSPLVKISGRARQSLVNKGINLKETFVRVGAEISKIVEQEVVEAGGHPMAAGAFVHNEFLDEYLDLVSIDLALSRIISRKDDMLRKIAEKRMKGG